MMLERAASAGLWATIEAIAGQGVALAVTLILARLLTPADFGVFAIAMFFSSLAVAAINSAFSQALIQRTATTIEEESSVFWAVLSIAAVVAAIFAIAARWLASFYVLPDLATLMFVVAGQIVVLSLSVVPAALLARRMEFSTLAKIALVSSLVSGVVAVAAAAAGAGIWALALQLVSSALLTSVLTAWLGQWKPAFCLRLQSIAPLARFSAWIGLSGLLEIVYSQGSALIVGKLYGSRDLGFFDRARVLNQLPGALMTGVIARIALPLFAQTDRHDTAAQRQGIRRASGFAMLIFLPVTAVCVIVPDLVVQALIGSAWLPAAPIIAVLALSSIMLPVHAINLQLLLARGGAAAYFRLEIAKKIVGIVCIVIGLRFGLIGLAWGYVAASVIALFLNIRPTERAIGYGLAAQLADLAGLFVCTGAMAAVVLVLRPHIALGPEAALVVLCLAGGASYLAVGSLFRLRAFREGREIASVLFAARRRPASQGTGS